MDRLESWKEIAHFVGRSVRWCRRAARREDDPLPVYRIGSDASRVCADRDDLKLWERRQRERFIGRRVSLGSSSPLQAPAPAATSYVYFVQAVNGGPIKIGVTADVAGRLGQLQIGSPVELRLLAVVPGSEERERELHQMFAGQRLHGEWFEPDTALERFIRLHAVTVAGS